MACGDGLPAHRPASIENRVPSICLNFLTRTDGKTYVGTWQARLQLRNQFEQVSDSLFTSEFYNRQFW